MTNATKGAVTTARETVEQAEREVNRWGMVLAAVTDLRAALRRGGQGADPSAAVKRFEPLVTGGETATPADRRNRLAYLTAATIDEGPGAGSTYEGYARTSTGDLGPFASTFEGFLDDNKSASDVVSAFRTAVQSAVNGYESDPAQLDELVALMEAGIRAAKAHRDARIDDLNNDFEDSGRTDTGLIQDFTDQSSGDDPLSDVGDNPVAMLPVGLETRFVDGELRIRVYPDDVHVDTHEPELTLQEERWGKVFWAQVYAGRFRRYVPANAGQNAVPQPPPKQQILDKVPDDDRVEETIRRLFYGGDGDGTTFADFSASVDERYAEVKERAWDLMVERAGRERGAYVVHRTAPVDKSSNGPATAAKVLAGPPRAGNSDPKQVNLGIDPLELPAVENRPASWTRQPRARFLPDRWTAYAYWEENGEEKHAKVRAPNAIRDPLYIGPNPESVAVAKSEEGSTAGTDEGAGSDTPSSATEAVDEGMEWMVDFDLAERAGMALRITDADVGSDPSTMQFTKLIVVGTRSSMEDGAATEEVRELVDVHHYTEGLEFLPEGTPTNNHDKASGYSRTDDPVESMRAEVGPPLTAAPGAPEQSLLDPDPGITDGNVLAQALGIDPNTGGDHAFAHVEGADRTEWLDALNVNSALWPGTLGYYLQHLLVPRPYISGWWSPTRTEEAGNLLHGIRDHFVQYVRPGGPFPTLRFGDQPYGILPATPLSAHEPPRDGATTDGGQDDDGSVGTVETSFTITNWRPQDFAEPYWALYRTVQWFRQFWEGSVGNVPTIPAVGPGEPTPAASSSGSGNTAVDSVKDALRRGSFGRSFYKRQFYREDPTMENGAGQLVTDLSDHGVGLDPRLAQLRHSNVHNWGTDPPWVDYVYTEGGSAKASLDVGGTDPFLNVLPEMRTGDLVRMGFDPHVERFDYLIGAVYSGVGSITSWDDVSGIFDPVDQPLSDWLNDSSTRPSTAFYDLFDISALDPFEVMIHTVGPLEDLTDEQKVAKGVLNDLVGTSSDDHQENVEAIQVLFMKAVDEYIETSSLGVKLDVSGLGTIALETDEQDGGGYAEGDLRNIADAFDDHVVDRFEREWPPDGATFSERLLTLYAALAEHITKHSSDPTTAGNWAPQAATTVAGQILDYHMLDYLVLAYTFKGQADPGGSYRNLTSMQPVDLSIGLDAKVARDTSLSNLLLSYSTTNANVNAILRSADLKPRETVAGAPEGRDGMDLFDLLWTKPDSVPAGASSSGYATDRWHGYLDWMRDPESVTSDAVDDRFTSFQASLYWLAAEGWFDDENDRADRLFGSTLDAASHRLDAWVTSLATRRLLELRSGGAGIEVDPADALDPKSQMGYADGGDPTGSNVTVAGEELEYTVESTEEVAVEEEIPELNVEGGVAMQRDRYGLDPSALSLDAAGGTAHTYIGAYGFVTNLEADSRTKSQSTFPEMEYLQAPSIPQATTVAILRSGYRSHPSEKFSESLNIDLSPARVRKARRILDGLRQGLWLGEILGYHFERRLREVSRNNAVNLEQYFDEFREHAPLSADKIQREQGASADETAEKEIVDGYALYNEFKRSGVGGLLNAAGLGGTSSDEQQWIARVLGEIDEILDAVSDVLTAENTHQIQQGNYDQAGRTLKALAEGKHPRTPEVVQNRREQVGVTHRLLMLAGIPEGQSISAPTPWQASDKISVPDVTTDGKLRTAADGTPQTVDAQYVVRDDAAPVLNKLAGDLFPKPGNVQCVAKYEWQTGSDDEATAHSVAATVTIADLTLSPLDALYLTQESAKAQQSKLESHVAYYLLRHRPSNTPAIPNDADIDIEFRTLPDGAPDDAISFGEFVEVARSLREVVLESRAADATDLGHPGDPIESARLDAEELRNRADAAEEDLESVKASVQNRLGLLGGDLGDDAAQPSSSQGDGEFDLGADVERVDDKQDEFGEQVLIDAISDELGLLSASDFLSELGTLEANLPAGPVDPDEADEAELVQTKQTTVGGDLPIGDDVDAYTEPAPVTIAGEFPERQVESVIVEAEDGEDERFAATVSGDQFEATVDFAAVVDRRSVPVERYRIRPDAETAEIHRIEPDGADPTILMPPEHEATVTVVPPGTGDEFRSGSATITVRVESDSPSSRFRSESTGVAVAPDGSYQTTVDFRGVQPGTRFLVLAIYPSGGDDHLLQERSGRVVSVGYTDGIDDSLFEPMTTLPRLLWLDPRANSFTPLRVVPVEPSGGGGGQDDSGLVTVGNLGAHYTYSPGVSTSTSSVQTTRNVTVADVSATLEASGNEFDQQHTDGGHDERRPDGGSDPETELAASTDATVVGMDDAADSYAATVEESFQADVVRGVDPDTGELVDPGTVRELSNKRDFEAAVRDGNLAPSEGSSGGTSVGLVADPAVVKPVQKGAIKPTIMTERTLAGELDAAIDAVDWSLIDREIDLVPGHRTTVDADDRSAMTALAGLDVVDIPAASKALTGVADRGIVTISRKLGLPQAISVVATNEPFGAPDQHYYPHTDTTLLAKVRARIDAFLDDPWPPAPAWYSDELQLVRSGLVEHVQAEGVEEAFGTFLSVVSDPEWTVRTLAHFVEDPDALFRAVDDALYHPGNADAQAIRDLGSRLQTLASNALHDQATEGVAERFAEVDDAKTDFADPISTFAATLTTYSGGSSSGRGTFETAFDGHVQTLSQTVDPLATAYEAADLSAAFREGVMESLRRPMMRAAYYGVYGAVPGAAAGGSATVQENLVRQAEALVGRIDRRLDTAAEVNAVNDSVDDQRDRLEALFGDSFRVLTPFRPANLPEVRQTFGDTDTLLTPPDGSDGDPLPVDTWLARRARVRERPQRLRETLTYAEAVNGQEPWHFDVAQLPYHPDDSWVGLDGVRPGGAGRVSMVAHTDDGFDTVISNGNQSNDGGPMLAGLLIDEWVEQVPAEEETTAVAFRYDDPGTEPPQSILLATPPKRANSGGDGWTAADLRATVEETIDLARFRGVDLEALRPEDEGAQRLIGWLLPALFLGQDTNLQPNSPTVDFTVDAMAKRNLWGLLATPSTLGPAGQFAGHEAIDLTDVPGSDFGTGGDD